MLGINLVTVGYTETSIYHKTNLILNMTKVHMCLGDNSHLPL